MFSKILVPLDGSGTAEKVLPFARCFARGLQIPVELLAVVDIGEMARHISADQAAMVRSLVEDSARRVRRIFAANRKELSDRKSGMHRPTRQCG